MSQEIARPAGSAFDMFRAATTERERWEAGQFAVKPIPVPGFKYPVPPMFFDLPWNDDNDEIVEGILTGLAAAEDLVEATQDREMPDAADYVGRNVTVLGVAARVSDIEDARWGAYLTLTISVDNGAPEIVTTGAGEVCVLMWRLYCESKLPAAGRFVLRGAKKEGRKQPVGFALDAPFTEADAKPKK